MESEQFIHRIQDMTNLSKEGARDGAIIVLSLLSHRLTSGESDDIAEELPNEIRGYWNTDLPVTRLTKLAPHQVLYKNKEDLYKLIEMASEDSDLSIDPEDLVKAVFRTLKEQITREEEIDMLSQLPSDIKDLWNSV